MGLDRRREAFLLYFFLDLPVPTLSHSTYHSQIPMGTSLLVYLHTPLHITPAHSVYADPPYPRQRRTPWDFHGVLAVGR